MLYCTINTYITNRNIQDVSHKMLPRPAPELSQVCEVCHVPYGMRQSHAAQQVFTHLALKHLQQGTIERNNRG